MRTVMFSLFWIFAVVETLALQPRLNVTSSQIVSSDGVNRTQQSPDHIQQHPTEEEEEEELKWEKEPGTMITITITEEEEEGQGKRVDEESRTRPEELIEEENRGVAPSVRLSVDASLSSLSPSRYFSSTIIPSLITTSITTQGPVDMTQINLDADEQNTSLSGSPTSHFSALKNTSMLSSNQNRTHVNPSLDHIESSKETVDAAPTAKAARAGPTAMSLPSTFKTKAKNKDKRIAKTKKNKLLKKERNMKEKKNKPIKNSKQGERLKQKKDQLTPTPFFPYFEDHYCPPDCSCYGRVVQCSDKGLEMFPYGIPFNSRYILLMNNHIKSIPLDLLSEYLSMEFLVLSNNRLVDSSIEGAFEGIRALKRLYLDRNILQSVPNDLPASLEELRLDGNEVKVMSEVTWFRCPGLLILSLSNNSLESISSSFPVGVMSPLTSLHILSLSHNLLTSVPLHLPLSLQELYLRGNLIQRFQPGVFNGKAQLQVLDLSANRLTNKGLGKGALTNAIYLESLNLEGNFLKQVPRYLPHSLKTLNLEGNSISSISKAMFLSLPHLEHLGLARNKISKVVPGAFRVLPLLHQLDLSHNMLHQVPRQLPAWLVYIALNHNKIQMIPRDAFCSFKKSEAVKSRLVKVQLEHNLVDLGNLDSMAFSCLRGFQVVHFY